MSEAKKNEAVELTDEQLDDAAGGNMIGLVFRQDAGTPQVTTLPATGGTSKVTRLPMTGTLDSADMLRKPGTKGGQKPMPDAQWV